jgi:hypothetical protein
MRVTAYQFNAKLLQEHQKVIHQKNLHEFDRLNHQKQQKVQPKEVWARPDKVDIYA